MRAYQVVDRLVVNVAEFSDGAELPEGWRAGPDTAGIGWAVSSAGVFTEPASAQPAQTAKQVREGALAALVYDFGDGRVMQTRPGDEANMRGALEIMRAEGIASIGWVMADDVKHPVTVDELQTALDAGLRAAMQVWAGYDPG